MQLVLPPISLLRRFSGRSRLSGPRRALPVRSVFSFSTGCETIVRCVKGRVWITDGQAGDVVLPRGGKFTGPNGSKIVIEALEDSVVEISE